MAVAITPVMPAPSSWVGQVLVSQLRIDPEYQRVHDKPASRKRIADMAAHWDERRAEAITVSVRPDGSWYVINGGHRFLAARMAGLRTILAIVWSGLDRAEEARLYGAINTGTVRPNRGDLFRSALVEGNPTALAIARICDQMGVRIDPKSSSAMAPGTTRSIGTLENIYEVSPKLLIDTIATCLFAWPSDHRSLTPSPLYGVASFIAVYEQHPRYKYERIAEKLAQDQARAFIQRAKELAASPSSGDGHGIHKNGPRRAVLVAYNKHLKDPLPDASLKDFKALSLGRNPWAQGDE